jgi:hypothetical protein
MVMDTRRLRAAIFERSGIAVDEHDPIMAVLAASAEQTEEIGARLLRRASPVRAAVAVAVAAAVFAAAGTATGWVLAEQRFDAERAEWLRQQSDPRLAALLLSEQGRAGVRLADLGVAALLANCNGRRSWRIQEGYCIPATPEGLPDGFRVNDTTESRGKGA